MTPLKEAVIETNPVERTKELDAQGRAYGTGRRKNSIARVWIKKGTGKFTINGRDYKTYLGRDILGVIVKQPLAATKTENKVDIIATATGGGLTGQAGAILLGIARALVNYDPENHKTLRDGGFLTRDSRIVERKKYGRKKARKGQTYRKR